MPFFFVCTSLSTTWIQGDHAVNASVNYVSPISLERRYEGDVTYAQTFCEYGKASSPEASAGPNTSIPLYGAYYPDCAIKQWVTVGLGYTYTGFKHWSLTANIQNLFDVKAPYDPTNTSTTSAGTGYNQDLHNAYGRYFNVSARYAF